MSPRHVYIAQLVLYLLCTVLPSRKWNEKIGCDIFDISTSAQARKRLKYSTQVRPTANERQPLQDSPFSRQRLDQPCVVAPIRRTKYAIV